MPNPAAKAIAVAQRTVARHAGLTVCYESGEHAVDGVLAVPAAVSADVLAEEDLAVRALAQDWLIGTGDLVYAGAAQKPRAGDKIRLVDGRGERLYEVLPLGGQSHFEPNDAYGLQWRVHSKLIRGSV